MDFLEHPIADAARDFTSRSAAKLLSSGESIGHYEVISFIGAGGMGQVYLARDTILKRKAAIKILSRSLADNFRGLRRFEHEARAASALNHPNILTIYEFGHVDDLHFIASEYVDGPTLRQKIAEGSLTLDGAVDIGLQVARALDAAHGSGIVHRDIKPENIIVRPDHLVKVLDFGIAKLGDRGQGEELRASALTLSISQAGLVIGSARYMSPEQARGMEVDARSDLFSLGVVLYEMIAGKAPFDGQTVSDVIAEILRSTPPSLSAILPQVPAQIENIVDKAMRKDGEARYRSAKEMVLDLEEFVDQNRLQGKLPEAGGASKDHLRTLRSSTSAEIAPPPALVAESGSIAGGRRARAWRLTIPVFLLIMILGGALFWTHWRNSGAGGGEARLQRLAILPFQNLRQDASLNYLGFSLADAIITKLSSVDTLVVRPSAAVEKYRNQSVDAHKIGRDLEVDTLLTGGFIKDGDDLRITSQLVDIKQDRILWRDSFDVKFDKLLAVQDRVSREIVKGMELSLSPAEAQDLNPATAVNPKAYDYYLRGVDSYSLNDFPAAIAMLEKSAALDKNYAPTWANLGRAYTTSATLQLGGRQQYDKAQAAYEKAIALNPNLVEARVYMANMLTDTGRVEQAVPLLRTSLNMSPNNAELHWELGYAYRFAGMLPESVAECERARELDPQVKMNNSEINAYLYLGEYDKFLESLPQDNSAFVLFYRGFGEYYEHLLNQAAKDFDLAYMLEPTQLQSRVGKVLSDSIAGQRAAALGLLSQIDAEMEERGVSDAESLFKIAQTYAVLGDQPAALHALNHTVNGGFFCDACLVTDPLLAGMRSDPEFQKLVQEARQRHDQFKARFF